MRGRERLGKEKHGRRLTQSKREEERKPYGETGTE